MEVGFINFELNFFINIQFLICFKSDMLILYVKYNKNKFEKKMY